MAVAKRTGHKPASKTKAPTKAETAKIAKKRREDRKAANTADKKAKDTANLRTLAPMAKEINVRLEKATKQEDVAYDHRLAAALKLKEAKKFCGDKKITFKSWVEENVDQSYETVRKLAVVGEAKNPKQALEDLRAGGAKRSKKSRAKTSTAKSSTSAGSSPPSATPTDRILGGFDAVDDKAGVSLVKSQAEKYGMSVVTNDEADSLKKNKSSVSVVNQIKALFKAAKPADQMTIVNWAAAEVGATLADDFVAPEPDVDVEGDPSDITKPPAFLKQKAPARKRRTRASSK